MLLEVPEESDEVDSLDVPVRGSNTQHLPCQALPQVLRTHVPSWNIHSSALCMMCVCSISRGKGTGRKLFPKNLCFCWYCVMCWVIDVTSNKSRLVLQ